MHSEAPGNLFSYLSSTYGSGNLSMDIVVFALAVMCVFGIIAFMQIVSLGRTASVKEAELLADVSELLNEMNIQIHELKSALHNEFTHCGSQLGYLRHELKKIDVEQIRAAQSIVPVEPRQSNSLVDLFQ
jgi:hypothetical protein